MHKEVMKILKIILLTVISIFIASYLAFLFVIPNLVDLNQYSSQITKSIQDNTGFQVRLEGLKVKTAWNLSAGAQIDKADLKDPSGKKFAQINNLQIRLSLIPLFFSELKVDKIDAEKLLINLDVNEKGELLLTEFFKPVINKKMDLKFSDNMPEISADKYRISVLNGKNKYSLKGENLKISDFILNKKIKLKTNGNLILNGKKQIVYDISIFSKILPSQTSSATQNTNWLKTLNDLDKYNVKANINADLKLKNKQDNIDIEGKINLDNISFKIGSKIFPASDLMLNFQGDRARINSNLYTDAKSKALITGTFNTGRHKSIDLQVSSDKLAIENLISVAKTISKTLGRKDFDAISANGFLKANFSIKSDFKKIKSSGYLKIKNANVTNNLYKVTLNGVNADIDFSQDAIHIKKAAANLNSQPIIIKGTVDKNANADISVLAENLLLKGVLLTSGNTEILKGNDILSGIVNVKASLKGRLDKATPKINVLISTVSLRNKQTKTHIKFSKATINSNYNENNKGNKGKIEITGLKISPNAPATILAPKINLILDKNNINIENTHLYINNFKTNLSGKITDLNTTPKLKSVIISVPNQISVPIKGYAGSKALLKGSMVINGNIYNPNVQGEFSIPLIRIPTISTVLKNITINFDKDIKINCPSAKIANSSIWFNATIQKDLQKGIIAKNVNFASNIIDLNTLGPVLSNLPQGESSTITIVNGKGTISKFRVGNINASNITTGISLKNNILNLNNLRADAYYGKIGGNLGYDFRHQKTILNLQGRSLSANPALVALTGRNDNINGVLDFDSNVSITGYSKDEILSSLKGNTNFIISNGQMGILGKFEHLIYAQNVISNNVFKTTLSVITKAIASKNTGVYRYMKGKLNFSNGWANIKFVKTSGPSMSLYINGRYNMLYNTASLTMLGRISNDVVLMLGPFGEFSMDKVISSIPKLGEINAFFANQFTINPNYENTSMIPELTPHTEFTTKEFKVVIDGDVQKQGSVKSFKWISQPKIINNQQKQYTSKYASPKKETPAIPDFVKNLPDLRN